MSIDTQHFLNSINKSSVEVKASMLKKAIEENKLEFVKAFFNQQDDKDKNIDETSNNDLALRVAVETGSIQLALEIIHHDKFPERQASAFELAVKKGQVEVVKSILAKNLATKQQINRFFVDAILTRNKEIVRLLVNSKCVDEDKRKSSVSDIPFMEEVFGPNYELIDCDLLEIILKDMTFEDQEIRDLLDAIFQHKNVKNENFLKIFRLFSEQPKALAILLDTLIYLDDEENVKLFFAQCPLTDEDRGSFLDTAFRASAPKCFQVILDSGPILDEDFEKVAKRCCAYKEFELLLEVLSRLVTHKSFDVLKKILPCIPETIKPELVRSSVFQNRKELLEFFLKQGESYLKNLYSTCSSALNDKKYDLLFIIIRQGALNPLDLGWILINACKNADDEAIKTIFQANSSAIHPVNITVTVEELGDAIILAAECGQSQFLEKIFENFPIDKHFEPFLGGALLGALENEHYEICKRLLAIGIIDSKSRGEAALKAFDKSETDLAYLIIQSGPISSNEYEKLLLAAAAINDENLFTLLLFRKDFYLTSDNFHKAVILASKIGNHKILSKLLNLGLKSLEIRREALYEAGRRGHWNCVQCLLENRFPGDDFTKEAMILAASLGQLDMFKNSYDKDNVNDALLYALKYNQSEIISYIVLKHDPLDLKHQTELLMAVIRLGLLDAARKLLNNSIYFYTWNEAWRVNPGHDEIYQMLSDAEVVNDNTLMDRLFIRSDLVKKFPLKYLKQIAIKGLKPVTYLNPDGTAQPGADAGGLSKQFIHELLDALFEKRIIILDDDRLPTTSEEFKSHDYRDFGILISKIYEQNIGKQDPTYLGQIFDKKTFKLLQILLNPGLSGLQKVTEFAKVLNNTFVKEVASFLDNPTDDQKTVDHIKSLVGAYAIKDNYNPDEKQLLEDCKGIIRDFELSGAPGAIAYIASGITNPLKNIIIEQGEACAELLLGSDEIDALSLIAKITTEDPSLNEKIEWIQDKILEESAKKESTWIRRFLICVTSQPVLPKTDIKVRGTQGNFCKAHTCFNTLDIPFLNETPHIPDPGLTDEQRFIKNLELTMGSTSFDLS